METKLQAIGTLEREGIVEQAVKSLGYRELKYEQKKAILDFISGKDVFIALPTGFGKTLIYCCLPRVFDLLLEYDTPTSIMVVVSPLKALMEDQVCSFKALGLSAAYVGEKSVNTERFITGKVQIVVISPESLGKGIWRDMLRSEVYQERLVALVIDEAHLVKNW